jgi:hypothetical protein
VTNTGELAPFSTTMVSKYWLQVTVCCVFAASDTVCELVGIPKFFHSRPRSGLRRTAPVFVGAVTLRQIRLPWASKPGDTLPR